MSKNKLSTKFKAKLTKDEFDRLVPSNTYKVLSGRDAIDLGLAPTGMTGITHVTLLASGCTKSDICHFANICRLDNEEIDQEPSFQLYKNGSATPVKYGILHHADFPGRTESLTSSQIQQFDREKTTLNLLLISKPTNQTGTLEELKNDGKIAPFEHILKVALKQ